MESLPYHNLPLMFYEQASRLSNRPALFQKKNNRYEPISWSEYKQNVERVTFSLQKLGVRAGEKVAILSENRPEWAYADLGILSLGAVSIPIYPTSTPKEITHILTHSEARIAFVSNEELFIKIKPFLVARTTLEKVILLNDSATVLDQSAQTISWNEFYKLNTLSQEEMENQYRKLIEQPKPDDMATMIYTSGTTGAPKGVMLSHRNFLVNCIDSKRAIQMTENDVTLSFLPLSHVFERMAGFYFPLMSGAAIAYAENMNTVPQNLLEVKPTSACGVPRLYEKIYQKIMETVQKSPSWKKALIEWALQTGYQTFPFRFQNQSLPLFLKIKYFIADLLIFKKLRHSFGGRLRYFISGGAPLVKSIGEFFYAAGITICEGYGLTETSPVISVNQCQRLKFGTVGIPLDHVQIRIAEDGEILVAGPSVMLGYYKDEQATREAIQDGWFHTGDIGHIDSDGFLVITDRKKDIIVTSGGKNVSPQNIENALKKSSNILQAVVLGDRHNYIVALIVPNFDSIAKTFKYGENFSRADLIQDPKVLELIRRETDQFTADFANYEKIKYFRLLPEEMTQNSGELTPTLKVKRKIVNEKYAHLIESMYLEGEKNK